MDQADWKPCWLRGSKIDEIVWIGKSTLVWCTGLYIVFYDFREKRQSLYWCWNQAVGEGARCLAGHTRYSIVAFSEKVPNPRILVYTYPSLTRVSECVRGCSSGYLATAFTARDHLVSMGSYPHFPMTVWCWRTGNKLASVNTSIRDDVGQILRITPIGPIVVAQMGKTCGRLMTWQIDIVGKVVTLKGKFTSYDNVDETFTVIYTYVNPDYEIKLPKGAPVYWVDWKPAAGDPVLAITDQNGHIFLSNVDGSNVRRVVLSRRCGVCLDIELPMISWFRDGIILRTTFCQIRYLKKNPKNDRWFTEWYVKSTTKPCILVTHPFKKDRFFYHTFEGYLMLMTFPDDQGAPRIEKYLDHGAVYKFVDFIYPWCHHLIATDDLKELVLLESYSGTEVSRIDPEVNGDISCQAAHPDYPLTAVGTNQGELVIVGIPDPKCPRIVAHTRLQRRPVDLLKFSYSGKHLIAAEKNSGNCYCVSLERGKSYVVEALIQTQRKIVDVSMMESRGSLQLLVLLAGMKQFSVGQQMAVYDIPGTQNLIVESSDLLDLPGIYCSLWHVPGSPQLLIGSPYLTRQLRVQRVHESTDTVLVDGVSSGHHVRLANIFTDRHWITTSAFDGLVFIRDKTVRRVAGVFMAHHRHDFGTLKAMANRSGDMVVCLGYNGSLVAIGTHTRESAVITPVDHPETVFIVDHTWYERQKKRIHTDYSNVDLSVLDLLSHSKKSLPGSEEEEPTWSEWRSKMQAEEEAKECEQEKAAILADFANLKAKIKRLLDLNEASPEIERIPVSMFALDQVGHDQQLKSARDEREDVRQLLEHTCKEMNRVSSWIKTTFWDQQKGVAKSLFSIFGKREVTNYPTVAQDLGFDDHLRWSQFAKDSVATLIENDTFRPWVHYTEEQLQEELSKRARLYREDEKKRIDLLLEEEDKDVEQEDKDDTSAEGTTTHRFIEQSCAYFAQSECYGFEHVLLNCWFLRSDCMKLRFHFNKAFNEVYAMKEREITVIRERIERIRHIDSELRVMFGQRVSKVPTDPEWHLEELPENIIRVQEHEVKSRPYVSPSQQELLDKQAAEAERIRLLLLADDFRERALMKMMDGVLEVRWEDVIKIDVPKPRCMLEKKPDEYTADDIVVVKKYQKDVKFLNEERERYRRILESEYARVTTLLQDGIDKFNGKLNELFKMKIKIEAAINQLDLRYVRGLLRSYRQVKALEEEDRVKEKITEKLQYEATLTEHLQTFQNVHLELLAQHEALCNREKTMFRRFKNEFSGLGKLNCELLERQFKRRPRTNLANLSSSDLLDLGSSVLTKTWPIEFPVECIDYLRALDHLDVRPVVLVETIQESNWDQLTRLRRQKIDLELKIRAKQAEIVETDTLTAAIDERISKCKSDVEGMKTRIQEMRRDRVIFEQDIEVQFVLKMGQVEIKLKGNLEDAADAIYVRRSEIDAVNELIRAAGSCKLDALTRTMNFHRGTLLKQWEHSCLKKRLADLSEDLRFTRSVILTKNMQAYLKRRYLGFKEDKTPLHLDRALHVMRSRYEHIAQGHAARLRNLQQEIAALANRNQQLDRKIVLENAIRCEAEQRRDVDHEEAQKGFMERRMKMVAERSEMIKKLQENYAELLALQMEHELLRLKKYPMLRYQIAEDGERQDC